MCYRLFVLCSFWCWLLELVGYVCCSSCSWCCCVYWWFLLDCCVNCICSDWRCRCWYLLLFFLVLCGCVCCNSGWWYCCVCWWWWWCYLFSYRLVLKWDYCLRLFCFGLLFVLGCCGCSWWFVIVLR